ncbi:MAG: 30S ribosomal protein S15 [Candidatus Woesearchaeota archaeon]
MARIYSRKKGKSGSTKPMKQQTPAWMSYKPKEIEILVLKLAKEGKTPSQIGVYLRDAYGIPWVKLVTKKSVTQILKEKNLLPALPEDLMSIIKKNVALRKHLEENKQDKVAKRGLTIAESKIKRLVDYYKKSGRLPKDWKYSPEKIRMLLE